MKKHFLFLFIILFSVSVAEARQVNGYNLNAGDIYTLTTDTDVSIDQMMMGQALSTTQNASTSEKLEVMEVMNEIFTIQVTLMSSKLSMSSPMGAQSMSSEGETANDLLMKVQVGTSYSFKMDKKGKILEINGLDEVRTAIKEGLAGTAMAMAADQVASAYETQNIKSQWQTRFSIYPEEETNEWTSTGNYILNNMPVDLTSKFAMAGDTEIEVNSDLVIKGQGSFNGMTVDNDLSGTQGGTFTLDKSSGMPVSTELTSKLEGTVSAQGMSIPMTLNSTNKITIQKN